MEAPEKIYLYPNEADYGIIPWGKGGVEYTRTDAFIKKAEKYLKEKFIKDVSVLTGGVVNINFDIAFSNFIKYMKE